jgi:hypothetical protein
MTHALERMSTCPACTRPVRLTRAELAAKRSFCAMCETEFDIAVADLGGDSVFREQSLVVLAPVADTPDGIRQSGRTKLTMTTGPLAWAYGTQHWPWWAWPVHAVGRLAWMTAGTLSPRLRASDEIEIQAEALVVRRRRWREMTETRIPIPNIASFTVERDGSERHIDATTLDRGHTRIAVGLGHREPSLIWVIEWLRKRLGL